MPEISITQHVRPHNGKRNMHVDVPQDVYAIYKKKIRPIIGVEVLPTSMVAIYGRLPNQGEEQELTRLAENGPGDKSPTAVLCQLIRELGTP